MNGKQITIVGLFAAFALTLGLFSNNRPTVAIVTPLQTEQASSSSQYFVIKRSIGISDSRVEQEGNAAESTKVKQPTGTTQVPQATVSIQLSDPDGTSIFHVRINPGDDLCANLVEAKAEDKIKSLTVDDSYLETFHSRYIREINGYSNNWTVEVNDVKPEGCSLYYPKAGDQIIWRFGV